MSDAQKRGVHALMACLVLILLAAALPAGATLDAGRLKFDLSLEPKSLTAPGEVTVSVSVSNLGEADFTTPLSLYDADGKLVSAAFDGGQLSQLPAGGTRTWQGKWAVGQQHLDAGRVVFTLQYEQTGPDGSPATMSLPAAAEIAFTGERVALSVTRRVTPEVVRQGGAVTVIYELVNTGNVKLKDIKLRENRSIADKTHNVGDLAPGAGATATFAKTNVRAALESSATITYYKEGDKAQQKQTVEALAIPLAKPNLKIELSADHTSVTIGETVTLTLTLKNEGNISYSGVRVTDAKLGEVFTDLAIPAGQTVVKTREVRMAEPVAFRFSIELQDNTGTKKTERTEELKVSAYDPSQVMRLNLQLSADRGSVSAFPGHVRFTVLITNDSNAVVKNIRLMHGDTLIYTIGNLEPGQTLPVTRDYHISQAGRFRFSAHAVDALNNPVSFQSNELNISYAPRTPQPTTAAAVTLAPLVTLSPIPPDFADPQTGRWRNTLFILALGVGALFAAGFVLFAVSTALRLRARRQSGAAYDHLELEQRRDFNDPDTYGAKEPAREGEAPADPYETGGTPDAFKDEELPHHKYLKDDPAPGEGTAPAAAPALDDEPGEEGGYSLLRDQAPEDEAPAEGGESRRRRAGRHNDR